MMFVLALAVSQVNAQNHVGFDVEVTPNTVAAEGHNQQMGKLKFTVLVVGDLAAVNSNADVDLIVPPPIQGVVSNTAPVVGKAAALTISYGGLKIKSSGLEGITCTGTFVDPGLGVSCGQVGTDTSGNDAVNDDITVKTLTDKIVIEWGYDFSGDDQDFDIFPGHSITIDGVRVDVSGKSGEITATLSGSTGTSDGSQDIGGGSKASASTVVSTVAAGLSVPTVTEAALLTCSTDSASPSIKVAEGFGSAWEHVGSGAYAGEGTSVYVHINNAPAGVTFKWPASVGSAEVKAGDDVMRAAGLSTLTRQSAEAGNAAIYLYSEAATDSTNDGYMHADIADSFTITLTASAGAATMASDKPADISAWLYPAISSASGLARRLSYKKVAVTDDNAGLPAAAGQLLTVADCMTYLLFPYVTCSSADWTTGLAISNTTKDDSVFGRELTEKEKTETPNMDRGGATPQSGAVYVYGYPMSTKAADGGSGTVPAESTTMVSSGLMSGDTLAISCDTAGMTGMDGYAIVEARFQEATGMAFVLGNFSDGATFDVAHGYMAKVIGTGNRMRD